ncbi:hypothetical protein ABZW18_02145 [Streptomyces sp. NPDC004647]|uniref:hypothetical protein n=1 Tax=Streptomyces sp. NPDC004647 TaxID=3154671 RepID=UPI0033AC17C8
MRFPDRAPGRAPGRIRGRAVIMSTALAGALVLTAGCGGGDAKAKVPKTATGTVEQLAAKATCKPNMQIDADELRQGLCKTKAGKYVLATFTTHQGQQKWLTEAQIYGGSYLVGRKWVAVGDPKVLGKVRGRLGGVVETSPAHGHGGDSHGGGSKGDHSHKGDSHKGDSH